MSRRPEIGNVKLYPNRPLRDSDKHGYVLKFWCPIQRKRIRRFCSTRDRGKAKRIMRECQQRLLDGSYANSGGAVTAEQELTMPKHVQKRVKPNREQAISWDEAYDLYRQNRTTRVRQMSLMHSLSRVQTAERIFATLWEESGAESNFTVQEVMTLDKLEYLQDRLLEGDEGRYDYRSPNTVNSTMGAIMAFVNFCYRRGWIPRVPAIQKLDADDAMRGRPISSEEFQRMLDATPKVVGDRVATSWQFTLKLIWQSGFRLGDVMDFCWHDTRHICPMWPDESRVHPTIKIPSTQKNGRNQEVPMLPGLSELLDSVPADERNGWIADPHPIQQFIRKKGRWIRPTIKDMRMLVTEYSNRAISRVCEVSDVTVAAWLKEDGISRPREFYTRTAEVPENLAKDVRKRGTNIRRSKEGEARRLSKDRVSRVICRIGEEAGIIVVQEDERTNKRRKYASAHDIRRGFARRLINAGVSAETLKVVMRHASFSTTEKHYGAIRSAQAAAIEVQEKLASQSVRTEELVDQNLGQQEKARPLVGAELELLKSLIARL